MLKDDLRKFSSEIEAYLTASSSFGVILLNSDLIIRDCNLGFMRLFGPRQNPVGEPISAYIELDTSGLKCGVELKLSCSPKSGKAGIIHCQFIQKDNGYLLLCEKLVLTESRVLEQMGKMNDELINMQREVVKKNRILVSLQSELDKRVAELEATLAQVKQLEGIIPICMYCKKIRDDQESWHQLEAYISDHSEALFSHGMCPDCLEARYPDFTELP